MPTFVAAGIEAYSAWAGTEMVLTAGQILLASEVAVAAGTLAYGMNQAQRAKRAAKDQYNASQVDRLANVVTSIAPRDLVLGRVRKGGAVVFRGSTGANKTTFLVHLALAGHEIDAVEAVYFNDVAVTLSGGYVQDAPYSRTRTVVRADGGTLTAGSTSIVLPHAPLDASVWYQGGGDDAAAFVETTIVGNTVNIAAPLAVDATVTYGYAEVDYFARVWWDLGSGSTADARTIELFPDLWTTAHKQQGTARLFCEFTYDETAFPSGLPVVTAQIRGAKVYDPRTTLTAWSENPALLMRHVYQHAYFGKATVSADEDTRFTAAANACDTSQGYVVSGVTTTTQLYRAGIVAQYGTPAKSLLDDLAQSMGGMWAFAGGELYLRAGTYTASVLTLTDADLAVIQREGEQETQEPIAIAVHREQAQKFNTVNLRIWDQEQAYKEVPLTPVAGAALVTRDGKTLAQEVQIPAVTYSPQAQHIAGVMMRDARDPLTFEAPFKLRAWPLELFDTVSVTLTRYGWSAKTFVVMKREWDRARGMVKLTMKETSAAIYTPDAQFLPQGYAENTALPDPWDVEPPTLTPAGVTSGTDELLVQPDGTIATRVRVAWTALTDSSISQNGFIDIEWLAAGSTVWQRVTVSGDSSEAILNGPVDGQVIFVHARARNVVAQSDWGALITHQVVGKTEVPPDITLFAIDGDNLSWIGSTAVDRAGAQLRFNYGNNDYWGSATPLHDGLITDSAYTLTSRPSGVVTFLVKEFDTSGNESDNAAVIVTDLGDPEISNVLVSYPEAPTFTGTITNGAVAGGVLQASALDRFYGDDEQPFYGQDGDPFYPASTYAQLVYEWIQVPAYAGTLKLLHTISASDYSIEFKRDSQDAFYGRDADAFYGDDADPFYGTPGDWQVWPGSIAIVDSETITWRVTAAAGATRGEVTVLTAVLDVPDVSEHLDDVVIAPGGTRLPITNTYTAIQNVQITLQNDGNGGRTVLIEDKNSTLGPLITVRNSADASVAAVVDADIKGY